MDNAGQKGALGDEITAITDPLLSMSTASTDARVVASLQRLLTELKPHQAELVRRCAIPRWFDAEVLEVLRDDRSGNGRAFEVIRDYSFVRPLSDGRYAYHDQVRAALLREWISARPEELRAIHERLATYFRERAEASLQRAVTPPNATPATSAAPVAPRPSLSTAPTGRWELYRREALYHALHADPPTGMEHLRAAFERAEASHRLGDAEALLQLTADVPLDDEARRWVRYLRARIELAALRLDEAIAQLGALRAELPSPPASLLAASVSQTLGEVYAETGQWAQATACYQASLAYFAQHNRPHEAAIVRLRLGAVYQELAANTGGWHVPAYPQRRLWRRLAQASNKLLALPFYVVAFALRRTPFALPGPDYLAFYQNWLLIWLYRTARTWYERARAGFAAQHDLAGELEAEQRLAQIALIFGYADDALARLDGLRARASDAYARAWIDRDRAEALLAKGDADGAEALLDAALAVFQQVGDMRREAAVLALKSRIAAQRGETAPALAGYYRSLARFRALHYAAAREQVLHDLRAWRRMVGPGAVAAQVGALLAAEPEKRYVGRFVRAQLAWLQVLSVAAFPLTLLLLAIFAPTIRTDLFQSLVRQSFYFDPWRALTVIVVLLLLYSLAYTLVALAVIFVIPFEALDREQPDYIVTDAVGIARYDYAGNAVQRLRWADVRRWARYDRRLWSLPHPLFSAAYLEDTSGQQLRIDGITGWYTSLQEDIGLHLAATGSAVPSEDLGYTVIRSKSGASVALGLLLILICAGVDNNWFQLLLALLPPWLYALIWLLAFSNALILAPFNYWFAIRPLALRRALGIRDWWPATVGLIGLATIVLARGHAEGQPFGGIPALAVGLTVWGAHIIAEALATHFFPRHRAARAAIIAVALLVATLTLLPLTVTIFVATWNRAAAQRTALLGTPQVFAPLVTQTDVANSAQQSLTAAHILVVQPDASPEQKARAYANAGQSLYATGSYAQAVVAYDEALTIYTALLQAAPRPALIATLAGVHFNRGQALKAQGDAPGWQQELRTACALDGGVAAECR